MSILGTLAGGLTGGLLSRKKKAGAGSSSAARLESEANVEQQRDNRYLDILGPSGGQDALNKSTQAAVASAMPDFRRGMQDVQETEVARGVGLGGLGTSYEGDLESAFQKNIANATAGRALDVYNTEASMEQNSRNRYLDLLTGNRDYETAVANAKKKRKSGLFGALGSVVGGVGGFLVGGPAGAMAGSQIGGSLGAGIGG